MRSLLLAACCLLAPIALSACTDAVEPNQLAFVMGTAVDRAEGGLIEISDQIVIPSQLSGPFAGGGAGDAKSSVVVSATGRDVFEASEKIQRKMSRRLMTSHRILIAISEAFFKQDDAGKLFDKLGRDPANNMRDLTLVVRGDSAKELLMLKHPLERLTSIAAEKELHINGLTRFSSRQLILEHDAGGLRPLLPVLKVEKLKSDGKAPEPFASLYGFAVLNKQLRIQGILDEEESAAAGWMSGKVAYHGMTIPGKNGQGLLSFRLVHLKRKIRTKDCGESKCAELEVKAQAYLVENTTSLDMSEIRSMTETERYLNEEIQRNFQRTVKKIQRWGPDIFGIGEHLHRHDPYWWRSRQGDWDERFKTLDVTVRTDVRLISIGSSGGNMN
ncbi:Ger(x)C family spore germination protein [Cohnella rhizosphaerae]|uniref:Ger(X)C family spore germination protein n=1 Tax=Cohnella rhizosphaerae TaxID=1457232 RepID=A0A9X4QSA4_9BACL|nr:Ger(x)C family spore germination protein [Cohnella rhizosphaerae]MDG0809891.1 Ger(x)C family spore germination protein [Cohnella rhizosphaerae]